MYNKVPTDMNFADREKEIMKFWKENRIFEKSVEKRENAPIFTFYDGPPTANGKPHIGHVLTRAVKDIIPRYKTMKGFKVLRKAGWDTHGLPVELEVEKALGISGKPQIEEYGVEPFIKKCKESVWKYKSEWEEMSYRVGFWADMDNPYITYDNKYIESVWWALKQIWDKDLLYKGHKVVPYCPRCGTSLSSHEVAQGYKEVKEKSVFVKFRVEGKENEYLLAWTTTPWTLPSNVALAVNGDENYAKVSCNSETYIMAETLLGTVLKTEYVVIETFKGKTLKGLRYVPLFPFTETSADAHFVVCDGYVTLTDGTGIVHTAPAFGEDDARLGRENNLPFVQLVNEHGLLSDKTPWGGKFVKDADPLIIKYMKENGSLYKETDYVHNYPFCWRCDTSLIYYARESWFIKMTTLRDNLIRNNNTVNWMPDNVREGRFGNFLENVVDWGLSRERYWGTPLPVWECGCGHRHCIGSIAELLEMSPETSKDIELHKPYIDKVQINCPKCGEKMTRVSEVIDCWFDAGSMPFAQWHYPFENKEIFAENFPADFISEAVDQTRGWFYTLLAISTLLFDKTPYKNVIVLGHIQDKNGIKMSKHKGNVIDPWDVLEKQGADAVRWYFYSSSAPWIPNRFFEEALSEGQRKFMGTLWNTYAFYVLYANIDNFNALDYKLDVKNLPAMDKWILSKLNSLIKYVDEGLTDYKLTETSRRMNDFVDELSNWYVRRSRERFWGNGIYKDKIDAYMTLYTVIVSLAKISAPYTPFMADAIYQNLVADRDSSAPQSVHLCDFPTCDSSLINAELEREMDLALLIVIQGRAARNAANIKNRQPISLMYVRSEAGELSNHYKEIIADELNVKEVTFIDDVEKFTSYKFKPQLKTLGPKYGKLLSKISQILSESGKELLDSLKSGGAKFMVDGTEVHLTEEDVLVESAQTEGFALESDKGVTVVIKTTLTPELIEEGFVRELISKIQTMRKESDFEVLDKINVTYSSTPELEKVIQNNIEKIKMEVLAESIARAEKDDAYKEWNINGENARLAVRKI